MDTYLYWVKYSEQKKTYYYTEKHIKNNEYKGLCFSAAGDGTVKIKSKFTLDTYLDIRVFRIEKDEFMKEYYDLISMLTDLPTLYDLE